MQRFGSIPTNVHGSFEVGSLSSVLSGRKVGISVHGGRAFTNNEALVAVLAAADHADIDWLIEVMPDRYKGGPTFDKVRGQLEQLQSARGIDLHLIGVTIIGF